MSGDPPYEEFGFWWDSRDTIAQVHAKVMRNFARFAEHIFARHADVQSVMVTVAQYYNDEADDAIHDHVVTSHRRTPMWPHVCVHDNPAWDDLSFDQTAGDYGNCCSQFYEVGLPDYFPFPQRGAVESAFGPYCSKERHDSAFVPYAVARRTETGAVVEVVRVLHRPAEQLPDPDDPVVEPRLLDERGAELFREACEATSDGPRHVLADHLLAHGDPHGEYLALALAPSLDEQGRARMEELFAAHHARWIAPLDRVIPRGLAVFERGLLAAADVWVAPEHVAAIESAPAWSSVERLHFLPGSASFVTPAMRAVRELGPLAGNALAQLANDTWNIERLHVVIRQPIDHERLKRANLPRLRELVVDGTLPVEIDEAAWWPQLERLTFVRSPEVADWLARAVPAAYVVAEVTSCELGADGRLSGWEIAVRHTAIEVTLLGWSELTRTQLRDALGALPARPVVLRPSRLWTPTDDDLRGLELAGRTIEIAG
ncbi:MAG: hypothetical protein QM765_25750 [Myxococcales bacterium]